MGLSEADQIAMQAALFAKAANAVQARSCAQLRPLAGPQPSVPCPHPVSCCWAPGPRGVKSPSDGQIAACSRSMSASSHRLPSACEGIAALAANMRLAFLTDTGMWWQGTQPAQP